jgi:hypothetical protein
MLTWKLWRALHDPPLHHPLFAHVAKARTTRFARLPRHVLPLGVGLLILITLVGVWRIPPSARAVVDINVAFIVALLLFTGTIHGLIRAASISHILMRMRVDGKYDLLRLSIRDEMALNWTICTGYLHRGDSFHKAHGQRARITQVLLMIPMGLLMPLVLGLASKNEPYVLMLSTALVQAVVVGLMYYVDYAQSVIIGGLVGMFVPIHSRSELDARLLAGSTFLAFQISSYALTWWLGFVVLPTIYSNANSFADLSLTFFQLVIFYVCREGMITLLWHALLRQLRTVTI